MNTNFEEQLNRWMRDWNNKLERIRLNISLGKLDATEAFEEQKDQLRDHLAEWKSTADKVVTATQENVDAVKKAYENLILQLSLGKAEAIDTFVEQRQKIEQALHNVYEKSKQAYGKSEELREAFNNNAQAFKTNLEIIQLQFALGKMEARDEAEKINKLLHEKMNTLQQEYNENYKQDVDAWAKQMQEKYTKVKSWMNEFRQK
ncbi:MAG TPA: hypothetical protein VK202_08305 [Bacteroidia bacterium]|nr:hypothetical protein [Bacteroidia bacterium]